MREENHEENRNMPRQEIQAVVSYILLQFVLPVFVMVRGEASSRPAVRQADLKEANAGSASDTPAGPPGSTNLQEMDDGVAGPVGK